MAVKECVECGEMVSEDAKTCPHCGKEDPTSGAMSELLKAGSEFLKAGIAIAFLIWWSPWSSDDKVEPKNYPISNATYSQVEYEVGCKSQYSDEKKEDIFNKKYKNHKMSWRGSIDLVESDEVSLNLDGQGTQDIKIDFLNSKAGYNLRKGQYITVEFIMDSMGGCFLPFGGEKGIVVQ